MHSILDIFFILSLILVGVIWKELSPSEWLMGILYDFVLILTCCWMSTVGGFIPRHVVLVCTRYQALHLLVSKPASRSLPWFVFNFLPWLLPLSFFSDGLWSLSLSQISIFPQVVSGYGVRHSNRIYKVMKQQQQWMEQQQPWRKRRCMHINTTRWLNVCACVCVHMCV